MRLQVQALSSLMTAERMQLVYANTLHGFPSIRAAAESEIPSVWIIRESEPWWAAFDGYSDDVRSIAWKACEQAERIVFVADATRRLWGDRIAQERAVTIPNRLRVDPAARAPTKEAARAFLGIGMEECVILNIGELSRLKGQADLVKAFGKLHTSLVQQSRLIFLGNGVRDERRGLDRALAALPRERRERVRIDPAGPDSTTHFAAADVYAHASYSESCPRVILEAMAHQLPILAAGVYGVVEQVQDKTNAYLVKPGDIDGFAAGLTRLLTDHGERCRIANAARQTFIDAAGFSSLIAAHTRLIERIAIE
jgi:glycosyltransferase involved in cell wall biosynthesis